MKKWGIVLLAFFLTLSNLVLASLVEDPEGDSTILRLPVCPGSEAFCYDEALVQCGQFCAYQGGCADVYAMFSWCCGPKLCCWQFRLYCLNGEYGIYICDQ